MGQVMQALLCFHMLGNVLTRGNEGDRITVAASIALVTVMVVGESIVPANGSPAFPLHMKISRRKASLLERHD